MFEDKTTNAELFDIFAWANQTEQVKKDLTVELFIFNKHFTPFRLNPDEKITAQIRSFFLYDLINYVNQGVELGLAVKQFEKIDQSGQDLILATTLDRVERASYLMDFLLNRQSEILDFNNDEHEFKLIRGIVARFASLDTKIKPFYIVKQLSTAQAVSGATAWQLNGAKLEALMSDVALKLPLDRQNLIIGNQILVFNQAKFERLFAYDYQQMLVAEEKIAAIEAKFKLSLPDGLTIQALAKERKRTLARLQKLELPDMTQEEIIDYADKMQLELMTDHTGAIIIMDANDLDMFIGLLNEDYMVASVSNKRYEIMSKKVMSEPDGEPPRG